MNARAMPTFFRCAIFARILTTIHKSACLPVHVLPLGLRDLVAAGSSEQQKHDGIGSDAAACLWAINVHGYFRRISTIDGCSN